MALGNAARTSREPQDENRQELWAFMKL